MTTTVTFNKRNHVSKKFKSKKRTQKEIKEKLETLLKYLIYNLGSQK